MAESAITTIIVDDEPLGRDLVRHMLKPHPDFHIVAECGDGELARVAIARHLPAVVFLDIQMPRIDGMALLDQLEASARPLIIFLTAHDQYAVQAFAEHAFDYLLKPFDQDRFNHMLERVRTQLRQMEAAKLGQRVRSLLGSRAPAPPQRVVIRETGRIYFVDHADIEWLEAEGNYVALHVTGGKTHLVHDTLGNLESRLDPERFLRIHRSVIVRVDRIKELLPHFNGEYVVVLKDATRLKLSRNHLGSARTALGLS